MSLFATILIVEDEKNAREGLAQYLENLNYEVLMAANGTEGWEIYQREKPELVLSDIRMDGMDGIALLEKIKGLNPAAMVILLTAYGSVEDAVRAMKKGAFYYLTKPVNFDELDFQVRKALASRSLEEENKALRQELFSEKFEAGVIVAESQKMKDLLKTVEKVAQTDAAVLIEGESGTGKELIAHSLHSHSRRRGGPFVAVHCAALTETLLASELFGHEKGAFTGATERKIGRFERAHQGTLFLDEIGEISPETQVKLLRVLQDGSFERVGGTKTLKADVRLVCATNKVLSEEMRAGRFREDLYYRINVINLTVPPLRDRRQDIPKLVEYFVKHFALANGKKIQSIDPHAMKMLVAYEWPGNVREVKNIVERMVVLTSGPVLSADYIPDDIRSGICGERGKDPGRSSSTLDSMERDMILKVLKEEAGNKSYAAKKLGISRRTLYRKLRDHKIASL
ncbi:MAG: sigma-54-dependent transcriptional regulator [Candidatus Omnitrophota bacterium]